MKNNKKGFTLIELLAVIVILAIIMVIAVPQILDVISSSRTSAWKDNVGMIEKALELNDTMKGTDPSNANLVSISDVCTDTSKLSSIVDLHDTTVECSGNVFTLTGSGQFAGNTATISCNGNAKCNSTIPAPTE